MNSVCDALLHGTQNGWAGQGKGRAKCVNTRQFELKPQDSLNSIQIGLGLWYAGYAPFIAKYHAENAAHFVAKYHAENAAPFFGHECDHGCDHVFHSARLEGKTGSHRVRKSLHCAKAWPNYIPRCDNG